MYGGNTKTIAIPIYTVLPYCVIYMVLLYYTISNVSRLIFYNYIVNFNFNSIMCGIMCILRNLDAVRSTAKTCKMFATCLCVALAIFAAADSQKTDPPAGEP